MATKKTDSSKSLKQEALDYHSQGKPGKIEVLPTKPYSSQRDLSLAYSPGVAEPCLKIAANKEDVYKYTSKGNLVAVISNGTAVLGLGDIGPEAAKPVMEGKGVLFKIFADIDVFDIEVDAKDVDGFCRTVKAISPTFGGINLEDIKAPEAFEIETRLKKELNIPVMHDDQHGTAIISGAALINALELAEKKIGDVKIVVNGAGSAAISCAKLYLLLGVKKENIVMLDSKGVLNQSRMDLDEQKQNFINNVKGNSLQDVLKGADVFLGLSKGNILTPEMLKTMAKNPIVFALANPDPEIPYAKAIATRPDVIVATGRSDHPNQVNNVLGFPFIFRGALDVRATCINEEMKLAAVFAIANLAKEHVPDAVNKAYGAKNLTFDREYILPKPLDHRLLTTVAPAVAKAAIDSGVAKNHISNWDNYREELVKRMGADEKLMRQLVQKAKQNPKRIAFAEAEKYKILKAAEIVKDEGIAIPILLGRKDKIESIIKEFKLDLKGVVIIDPKSEEEEPRRHEFGDCLFDTRKRRGFSLYEARKVMRERNYFGAAMVKAGMADALISGLTRNYPSTIRPALQVIGRADGAGVIAGMYIMFTKKGILFFADTTINKNPTAEELVEITILTAKAVQQFNIKPKIAMLSYSNFGASAGPDAEIPRKAVEILHKKFPDLMVDGEVQANFSLNNSMLNEMFPFSLLAKHKTNTLIFPNLASGNIAYKLTQVLDAAEAIGPVLLGMKKSVHILQLGSSVREIVNMVTIAVNDAQNK